MILTQEALKGRFEELKMSRTSKAVPYCNHRIGSGPQYSGGYENCNAIALLNHSVVGLSHHDSNVITPEDVFSAFLEDMLSLVSIESLIAVPVGGDEDHFERNKECLGGSGIPIVGEYLDYFSDDECGDRTEDMGTKSIVVAPGTQEVIMYSPPAGYVKLH